MEAPSADALLAGLDPDQHRAVTYPGGPIVVLAAAGSGKTRVLTRRIAHRVATGDADGAHVLALTFTRRAASELRRRLHALGVRERFTAGTFHGVASSVLRQRWADQGRTPPRLVPSKATVLGPLVDDVARRARGPRRPTVSEVAIELDWAAARAVPPDRYAEAARRAGRRPNVPLEQVADLAAAYEAAKRAQRVVDFDDLLALLAREMRLDAAFAEVQRWRFRHLFVDEFQDVNPLQFRLLEAWRGGRPDLFVVGDPDQAIYAWNGADPTLLARLPELVGGATVIRLARNHRSTPEIVHLAATVLPPDDERPRPDPSRPGGPVPTFHALPDPAAEAAAVVELAHGRDPVRGWRSVAVLARTHARLAVLEPALREAGIPVRTRPTGPPLQHPAVRALVQEAAGARRRTSALLADLLDLAAAPDSGPDTVEAARAASLLAIEFADLHADPPADVFATWLATGGAQEDGGDDAVALLTFHAAKGLEFPVVVVAGVERGVVPPEGARTAEARAEEARLLYVALTRATDQLHVTWSDAQVGRRGGRSALLDAAERLAATRGAVPPGDRAAPPHVPRPAPPTVDPALAALRAWRSRAATAAGVADAGVLPDRTLAALAAALPRTVDEVGAVPGVGRLWAARFGERVLAALADLGAPATGVTGPGAGP